MEHTGLAERLGSLLLSPRNPALWAAALLLVILPLIVAALRSRRRNKCIDDSARRKKTDTSPPDDTELKEKDLARNGQSAPKIAGNPPRDDVISNEEEEKESEEEEDGRAPGGRTTNEDRKLDCPGSSAQDEPVENGVAESRQEEGTEWNFPPQLEDFDLMDTDTDPTELEAIFADERLVEIKLTLVPEGPGLGISIVGGSGSPSGDLPIIVKRVLPDSLAAADGRLKSGDELVAVNDTLLSGVRKDVAINALSNMEGRVRLLVLQDD